MPRTHKKTGSDQIAANRENESRGVLQELAAGGATRLKRTKESDQIVSAAASGVLDRKRQQDANANARKRGQ